MEPSSNRVESLYRTWWGVVETRPALQALQLMRRLLTQYSARPSRRSAAAGRPGLAGLGEAERRAVERLKARM